MPTTSESGEFLRKLETGFRAADVAPTDSIICAVSGGPDSTALFLGAQRLRHASKSLTVAHFNHRTRGVESDGDEEFVRNLCAEYDVNLHLGHAPTVKRDLDEGTARNQRYAFFARVADDISADAVILAHTIDDQAETVLLRITRGTGVRGAGAMRPHRSMRIPSGRNINVARPMLSITRTEAVEFLESVGVTARHDSSNDDWRRYARNRIRHRVLPELQEINPNATLAIARFAEVIGANAEMIDEIADDALNVAKTEHPDTFERARVAELHPVVQAAVLARMHRSLAGSDSQLDQIHISKIFELITSGKSSSYDLPDGVVFRSDHQHIRFVRRGDDVVDIVPYPKPIAGTLRFSVPGSVNLGDGYRIDAGLEPPPDNLSGTPYNEAWLTPTVALDTSLVVRNRRSTDRFQPLGMSQDVNLSDFLINAKIPAAWRDRIPLVIAPSEDRIAWLPGIRLSEWAKLRAGDGKALRLRLVRDEPKVSTRDANPR